VLIKKERRNENMLSADIWNHKNGEVIRSTTGIINPESADVHQKGNWIIDLKDILQVPPVVAITHRGMVRKTRRIEMQKNGGRLLLKKDGKLGIDIMVDVASLQQAVRRRRETEAVIASVHEILEAAQEVVAV
jgi:hypothetical protein